MLCANLLCSKPIFCYKFDKFKFGLHVEWVGIDCYTRKLNLSDNFQYGMNTRFDWNSSGSFTAETCGQMDRYQPPHYALFLWTLCNGHTNTMTPS